jgi:hypothetical protein
MTASKFAVFLAAASAGLNKQLMTKLISGISAVTKCLAGLALLVALTTIFPGSLSAAEAPRVEVFGGYSRLQFDTKSLAFAQNTGLNGGAVGAAFNFSPFFGVVGEADIQSGPNVRVRDWLVGGQGMYSKWGALVFGHVMFGKAETRVITTDLIKDNGKAISLGGGFDYPITSRFSIRVIQVDYLRTHTLGLDQNNLKLATGLVYRWGKVSTTPKHKL